jgi:hypothetical protein
MKKTSLIWLKWPMFFVLLILGFGASELTLEAGDQQSFPTANCWSWANPNAVDKDFSTEELTRQTGPATNDMAGHWGDVISDAQASIRFPKNIYTPGEPIIATILLRNYSDKSLFLVAMFLSEGPAPFSLIALDGQGQPLKQKESLDMGSATMDSTKPLSLSAGWQSKFKQRVDSKFDLSKPGTYLICGYCNLGLSDAQGKRTSFKVTTANAVIHVVAQTNTSPVATNVVSHKE